MLTACALFSSPAASVPGAISTEHRPNAFIATDEQRAVDPLIALAE
jgi:hypothetical protein